MVNQGYKKTEIGVIPIDWEYTTWETAGDGFSSGATPYRAIEKYYNGDIKWVSSGELNYNVIFDTLEHISDEAKTKTNLRLHPANTFLMAITGLEAAGTRGSCAILGVPATTNQSCMAVYGTNKLDVKYLFYFYTKNGDDLAFKFCQGTKQQSFTAAIVKKLPIILPPIEEQKLIAEALSDIDNMISSLEKLIAKKKAVKQGAMQELLTGKKRLPGFTGEWKKIKFKETDIEVQKGQTITQKEISIGNIPVIAGGKTPAYYCDKFNRTGKNITISASGASAGFVNKYSGDIFASDCSTISESYKYNIDFVYYILLNMQTAIYASQTGGAQPHIHPNDIYELDVYYTFDLSEQNTIASILSDMDSEIEALEQKLKKTRQIKQGMMQQLLTGKIRLV